MKSLRFASIALLSLALPLVSSAARTDDAPGYFDFESLPDSGKGDYVEINVSSSLLSLAGALAVEKDPETAQLLKGLKQVRVNVVKLDAENKAVASARVEEVRRKLASAGWEQAVNVREKNGESVNIHLKTGGGDSIEGLVITVLEPGEDAVFINIVGSVKIEQLAKVAARLDIEPLKRIKADIRIGDKPDKS